MDGTATTLPADASLARDFLVSRKDVSDTRWSPRPLPANLSPGQVLLAVDKFGFTANNVTYAVKGDGLFWEFFPAEDGWFSLPVWGFADVLASAKEGVSVGERFYGCFPASTHLLTQVGNVNDAGFVAADPHRAEVPAIYNLYHRTSADTTYDPKREDEQVVLRPVFRTSFLLHDHLAENGLFGASTVVLGSASSKTALVLAYLLAAHRTPGVRIVALTSQSNRGFVEEVGECDLVLTYDELHRLEKDSPTLYVDMSGDGEVRTRLHDHLGEALVRDIKVGSTHWRQMGESRVQGVEPTPFSVADQMRRRTVDWGPEELQRRVTADWLGFIASSARWLKLSRLGGPEAMSGLYAEMIAGGATPAKGHVVAP